MGNRYYTAFPSRKITGASVPNPKSGETMNMAEKPAFPDASLPGKEQASDRSGGTKKCKVYPKSEGL